MNQTIQVFLQIKKILEKNRNFENNNFLKLFLNIIQLMFPN